MKRIFWTRTQPTIPDDCGTIDPLLSLYADGLASAEEARRVERHLPGCAACRESLAWMQATQRALALRPVVSPPADLRARIASALAASSAAPVSVSTNGRRAFALRPAYAAAASLTVLGLVVSYGLLHTQAPPVSIQPAVTPPPMIAIVPPVNPSAPAVKPVAGSGVKPHITRHPATVLKPARLNPDMVARAQPDEAQPEPAGVKRPVRAASRTQGTAMPPPVIALIKPHPLFVKKPALPKFQPEMTATTKHSISPVETRTLPVVQPETRKPDDAVAVARVPTPPAPVFIAKPPVVTQDPPVTVVAAVADSHPRVSNPLASVKDYARQMRTVAYTSAVRRSVRGASLATRSFDSEKTAYVPGIYTP